MKPNLWLRVKPMAIKKKNYIYCLLKKLAHLCALLAVQEPAVQRGASEAELLRDGEPVRSVSGGLPQGLSGERGQTTVAQRLDAGQVSADTLTSCLHLNCTGFKGCTVRVIKFFLLLFSTTATSSGWISDRLN